MGAISRSLVPHAAGGMLVHRERVERRGVQRFAGEAHRLGQRGQFLRVETAQEDRHQQRGGLGICRGICGGFASGDADCGLPLHQRADESLNLGVGESEAVALVLDYVDGVNGHEFDCMRRSATPWSTGRRRAAAQRA